MKNEDFLDAQHQSVRNILTEPGALSKTIQIASTGLRGIPGVMGGIETHCEELYPRILADDSTIGITVLARSPYVPSEPHMHKRVDIRPVWTVQNKYAETLLHTFFSIVRARIGGRFKGVHIHAIGPGLMTPLARLLGLRVVVTHHGADYNRLKWGRIAKTMLRLGEKVSVRFANKVITVSQSSADELQRRFPKHADRIVHIPNGAFLPDTPLDTVNADAKLFDELGVEPGQYVLAVGRLVPEKGFDLLVEAHKRSGTSRKLLIVGGADHEDPFSKSLRTKASDRCIFAGNRPRSELVALYREASVFVLPSFHEGLPIVALEAIHAGAPVLLSDIGPNLELGLSERAYFPVGDVDAMAAALSKPPVEIDPALSAELRGRYDWDRIAVETRQVFRDVFRANG